MQKEWSFEEDLSGFSGEEASFDDFDPVADNTTTTTVAPAVRRRVLQEDVPID